jgi:hypothetical protein
MQTHEHSQSLLGVKHCKFHILFIRNIFLYCSDSYDDSKESKKSRRQLCSNLFEHLFTQSDIVPSSSAESSSSITNIPMASSSSSTIPLPIVSKPQPPAPPKLEFAPIESFGQVSHHLILFSRYKISSIQGETRTSSAGFLLGNL